MIGVAIPPRVAFAGRICSGKTTAAQALVDELGFIRMNLADELKAIGAETAQWMWDHGYRSCPMGEGSVLDLKDKTTPVGRRWLQWLGTDCMRKRLPSVWIQMLLRKLPNDKPVVTDDVRFVNEAVDLSDHGYVLVRVYASEEERLERIARIYPQYAADPAIARHPSETELDDFSRWDHILHGGGPIDEFRARVVGWARREWGL